MKTKFILTFIAMFSVVINTQAQSKFDSISMRKNAIRFNILPPLLSATSEISYERLVKPNLSIVVGLGTNLSRNKSDFVLNSNVDLSFLNREVKNRYYLVQVRRYIDFCKCDLVPPHGFYTGGFVRYNNVNFSSELQFGSNSTNLETKMNLDFRALNFGAFLGYQINIKNFVVDFEFGGLGYGPRRIEFNASRTLSSDELAQLSDALSQNFGIGGNYNDIELTSSTAKLNFSFWTFRYGVSIGYNF